MFSWTSTALPLEHSQLLFFDRVAQVTCALALRLCATGGASAPRSAKRRQGRARMRKSSKSACAPQDEVRTNQKKRGNMLMTRNTRKPRSPSKQPVAIATVGFLKKHFQIRDRSRVDKDAFVERRRLWKTTLLSMRHVRATLASYHSEGLVTSDSGKPRDGLVIGSRSQRGRTASKRQTKTEQWKQTKLWMEKEDGKES